MILFVLDLAIMGLSFALWRRGRGHAATGTGTRQHASPTPLTVRGPEDDPAGWPPTGGEWTAWDEHQLTRLLKDSSS
jgi:hypothetical protein